ncbi:MAG: hypothetical protein R3F65_32655 [bacterium]
MTLPPDLPTLPPADAVEATVEALCELNRRSGIVLAAAIGRTVVEGIYGGDITRVRERRNDCPTLRAIAAHPRVPFSFTALHQAIGIYDLVRRFPEVPGTALTLTHLRLVLPYPDDVQRRLLRQAICGEWSTRQLEEAVRALKPTRGKGGRPRLPRVVKTLNHIDRVAREDVAWADLDDLAALPADRRALLARRVALLRRQLRGVELRLGVEADAPDAAALDEVLALPAEEP